MGYGLMAPGTDVTLPDIAKCCDVFYIGGTKVGALFGEAVVITNPCLKQDFRYCIKQKGGMLAKGRLLGVQFLELFKDGLYFEISKHAIDMAMLLKDGLKEKGYEFFMDSDTNQQFIIVAVSYTHLIARESDPTHSCVLTIGQFAGGTAANIIPETAVLQGTIRTNKPEARELLVRRMKEVAEKTAAVYNGTVDIEMISEVPPLICNPKLTDEVVGYMPVSYTHLHGVPLIPYRRRFPEKCRRKS